jgi:hypothetical protein
LRSSCFLAADRASFVVFLNPSLALINHTSTRCAELVD